MKSIRDVGVREPSSGPKVMAGRYPRRPGVLLVLGDTDGVSGVGEASPLAGYSPDDLESTKTALAGLTPSALNHALERTAGASTLEQLSALSELLSPGLPAARFALETAYLDLECRQLQVTPVSLLPQQAESRVRIAGLLPELLPSGVERARSLVAEGYTTLKVKLFDLTDEALLALSAIAELDVRLRVDANRSLQSSDVPRVAERLAALGVEFFEEPCAGCTLHELGKGLDLALDESLRGVSANGLGALLDTSGARVVVLKPMVLGGFSHCVALATVARQRGAQVVVSHTFDGPVALHAACLLALSTQSRSLAAGLAPHAGLDQWPSTPSPFVAPGQLDGAGFERPWLAPEQVLGAAWS